MASFLHDLSLTLFNFQACLHDCKFFKNKHPTCYVLTLVFREQIVKHVEKIVGLKTCFENNFRTQFFSLNTISEHKFQRSEHNFLFEHNFRTQFSLWTQFQNIIFSLNTIFFFWTQFQNTILHPSRLLHWYSNFFFWKIKIKFLFQKFTPSYFWSVVLELPWFEGMKQCGSGFHIGLHLISALAAFNQAS